MFTNVDEKCHPQRKLTLTLKITVLSVTTIVFYFVVYYICSLSDTCTPSPTTLLSTYVSRVLNLSHVSSDHLRHVSSITLRHAIPPLRRMSSDTLRHPIPLLRMSF